jgi:hypothetical protein
VKISARLLVAAFVGGLLMLIPSGLVSAAPPHRENALVISVFERDVGCPEGWTALANGICTPNDLVLVRPYDNLPFLVLVVNPIGDGCPSDWIRHANGICTPPDMQRLVPFAQIGVLILLTNDEAVAAGCPEGWTLRANGICTPNDLKTLTPFDAGAPLSVFASAGDLLVDEAAACGADRGEVGLSGGGSTIQSINEKWILGRDYYCLSIEVAGTRVEVFFAVGDVCSQGAWRDGGVDFNGNSLVFRNQGDCVSYFATGGKSPAAR